jgi:hypothetical protein
MSTIILTAVLAVVQMVSPVPRKTIENYADAQNYPQDKSGSPPIPSGPAMPANEAPATNPNQQNTRGQDETNENSHVVVVQGRPDVTIHKDAFDYGYIIGSLLLTLITLGIAGIAWKQANAARLNADAIINSERAWILLESIKPENFTSDIRITTRSMTIPLSVHFKNYGKTPAWVVESGCKFVRTNTDDFQGPLDYGNPQPGGDYAIAPNDKPFPMFPAGDSPTVTLSDVIHVQNGKLSLVLYGVIRYKDSFVKKNQPIRETYFCVHLLIAATGMADRWQLAGPEGANRCT